MTDVRETRSAPRFTLLRSAEGHFGTFDVRLIDLSIRGMQIEHSVPAKPGMRGRFAFRSIGVASAGVIVWSRLSKTPDGKLAYRSGVSIPDPTGLQEAIDRLFAAGNILIDDHSLDNKRRKLATRAEEQRKQTVRPLTSTMLIPSDHILLVEQARERLRTNPDEATNWYNRGRFAMATEERRLTELNLPHQEEVFAVWEYLGRTVDLVTIARVFEQNRS